MFNIMFMCKSGTKTERLVWIASHGHFYPLLDAFYSVTRTLSSTVSSSQSETLEFCEEHKPNIRSTVCNDETIRRLFNVHISIIYHGFTVTLVALTAPWYCGQKCGIFTLKFITGVMVYNYIMHVWLGSYRMSAFVMNGFRLFFIQIGYLKTRIVIFMLLRVLYVWF